MGGDLNKMIDGIVNGNVQTSTDTDEETVGEVAGDVDEVDEDVSEIEDDEDEESDNVDETEGTETVEESKPAISIKAKYNGADIEVPEEEAKELIQIAKFVKDNGGIEVIKGLKKQAKTNGFESVGEYWNQIQKSIEDNEVQKLVDEKMMPEEEARELVSLRHSKAEPEDPFVKEVREFNSIFPDETVDKLPQEVLDAKKENPDKSITDLYLRYQHAQGKSNQKVAEQNLKNKKTSTGSLKDTPDSSDYTTELINKTVFGK